jgi:hypothetical protein
LTKRSEVKRAVRHVKRRSRCLLSLSSLDRHPALWTFATPTLYQGTKATGKVSARMALLSTPLQYITSTPPVTRAFTVSTIVFTLFYYWIRWTGRTAPYLTLIPGSSLFYPWTFISSVFVETEILEVSTDIGRLHPEH